MGTKVSVPFFMWAADRDKMDAAIKLMPTMNSRAGFIREAINEKVARESRKHRKENGG